MFSFKCEPPARCHKGLWPLWDGWELRGGQAAVIGCNYGWTAAQQAGKVLNVEKVNMKRWERLPSANVRDTKLQEGRVESEEPSAFARVHLTEENNQALISGTTRNYLSQPQAKEEFLLGQPRRTVFNRKRRKCTIRSHRAAHWATACSSNRNRDSDRMEAGDGNQNQNHSTPEFPLIVASRITDQQMESVKNFCC